MSDTHSSEEERSWHDNLIYGLHLAAPDPDAGLWISDLILDIDHIVEWICGTDEDPQCYSVQAAILLESWVIVAPSNADAALAAMNLLVGRI